MAVDSDELSYGLIPLNELPEGCIANSLSLTSPRDACRLSLVAATFRSAAQSDDVWERFLPPDYRDILSRSAEGLKLLSSSMSKKQLYLHLCDNPILIDGGTKSFWLDKSSGKKCYLLGAKDLTIIWSDSPAYWKWVPLSESRFNSVAELLMVCWLEIHGVIKSSMLSPDTKYAAYLVFILKPGFYGFDDTPAEGSVGFSGLECEKQSIQFNPDRDESVRRRRLMNSWGRRHNIRHPGMIEQQNENDLRIRCAKERRDGWMEIELGEIFIKGGEDLDVEMRLSEVKGGQWKSGLAIEGIEIRPK